MSDEIKAWIDGLMTARSALLKDLQAKYGVDISNIYPEPGETDGEYRDRLVVEINRQGTG